MEKGERKMWVGGAVLRFLSKWALGLASARSIVASSLGLPDLAQRTAQAGRLWLGLGRGNGDVGLLEGMVRGVSWGRSWSRTFVLDPGDEWALLDGVGCWIKRAVIINFFVIWLVSVTFFLGLLSFLDEFF